MAARCCALQHNTANVHWLRTSTASKLLSEWLSMIICTYASEYHHISEVMQQILLQCRRVSMVFTSYSTWNRSVWRRVFPGNWLHLYWQLKTKEKNNTCNWKRHNKHRKTCTSSGRVTYQAVEPENGPEQSAASPNWSSVDHLDVSAYFLACSGHTWYMYLNNRKQSRHTNNRFKQVSSLP